MPNWCENELFVRGDEKEMERFLELSINEDGVFKLNGTYEMPEILNTDRPSSAYFICNPDEVEEKIHMMNEQFAWGFSEEKLQEKIVFEKKCAEENARMIEKTGFPNRSEWRKKNWGTKWDVDGEIKERENLTEIFFHSAWTPPTNWLEKVAKDFPNLKFQLKYREDGCGFEGLAYACGDEFEDESRDILFSDFWND